MTENKLPATKNDDNFPSKQTEPRAPRSIRFSDFEWAGIEKAAEARGMTAAELVRHAAVSLASGNLGPGSSSIPPETVAQIERIYRGVYLLSTLKRDELIRDGRQDECDRIGADARNSQKSIQEATNRTAV